jgi:hypothetical protein
MGIAHAAADTAMNQRRPGTKQFLFQRLLELQILLVLWATLQVCRLLLQIVV